MWIFIFLLLTNKIQSQTEIKIRRGESLTHITNKLYEKRIIKHPFWFKFLAKITGKERKIKAGYYIFEKPVSNWAVLKKLVEGSSIDIKVTIPEGSTICEIAEILKEKIDLDVDKFLSLTKDTLYIKKLRDNGFEINSNTLEGYLFPDTYLIPYGEEASEIIFRMVSKFFEIFTDEFKNRAKEINMSINEVVILASLIEKEAVYEDEKPIISDVYHKRLKKNIPLQCDATIQYILPKRKPNLTYSDLKKDSPYNTYLYKGLPPTAIGSPGKSSILAALYPQKTPYWYFVARGDGHHIFSETLKKHNLEKYRVKIGYYK